MTITLSRTYDKPSKIALNYEGLNFSANYNDDFITDKSDIISIAAGSTSANVKITGKDDSDEDPNENIVIQLNSTTGTPASENIIFEPQSVTVKIIADDNPPVAGSDYYDGANCVLEDGTLSITDPLIGVLANDVDPEGSTLTIVETYGTIEGFISCNGLFGLCPDGTFEFKHAGNQNEFNEVNFSYKIKDEDGLTAIGSATICVTPVNDPPTIQPAGISLNEGETVVVDLTESLTDEEYLIGVDNDGTFALTTNPSVGTTTLTPQGILTYTAPPFLSGSAVYTTALQFVYTDGGVPPLSTSPMTISIGINNSSPQPVADTFYVGVGQKLDISADKGLPSESNKVFR